MSIKLKNLLINELVYILGSPTIIMLGIVVYGILFDVWYKDVYNIALASSVIYVLSILFRLLAWASKKIKQ
jgi:hypothetical protein